MLRICAWCGAKLSNSPGGTAEPSDYPITHGICPPCADNLVFQAGVDLGRYLDSLEVPVVVVDGDAVVQTANDAARAMLGKELARIEGRRGGDVFECSYARLPGGCGRTEHCSACAIRRSVTETLETGKAKSMVEAYLNQDSEEGAIRHRLIISTEKVGGVVFLRVDGLDPDP
ncbi:MAG: PAS domain-containing protein [Thermodesulfobacteriota bacterium]